MELSWNDSIQKVMLTIGLVIRLKTIYYSIHNWVGVVGSQCYLILEMRCTSNVLGCKGCNEKKLQLGLP